ncbi:hypothetical protein PPNK14_04980 [Pectobacterium parmentieri]
MLFNISKYFPANYVANIAQDLSDIFFKVSFRTLTLAYIWLYSNEYALPIGALKTPLTGGASPEKQLAINKHTLFFIE